MPTIGSLTVELDLQTQKYEAGLKRSKQQIDQHSTSLNALQQDAIQAGQTMTQASDEIVAAWGKSGQAAQDAISKMESISRKSAVTAGIREMSDATEKAANAFKNVKPPKPEELEKPFKDAERTLKGLEQILGIHLPQATARFLAESKAIGPVLSAAFSGVALLGFVHLLEYIPEIYKKIDEAFSGWNDKAKRGYEDQIALNKEFLRISRERLGLVQQGAEQDAAANTKAVADLNTQITKRERLNELLSTWLGLLGFAVAKAVDVNKAFTTGELQTQMDALNKGANDAAKTLAEIDKDELLAGQNWFKQRTEDARKFQEDAKKKAEEAEKERQALIARIRKQNQDKLADELRTQEMANLEPITRAWKQDLDDRIAGYKDYEEHQQKTAENADEIIAKNRDRLAEELRQQEIANLAVINQRYEVERKGEEQLREEREKYNKLVQESSRQLASTLTRDFGQFLEHSTQQGGDFWRSFERFGINSLDAIKTYSDKIGGAGGLLGSLASIAPFAAPAVGGLEFGLGLGRKVGQGRNEADVFGANVLKPFQDQVGGIVDLLQQSAKAGTLTTEALTQAQTNFEQGWQNVLDAAAKTQTDVGKQAVATLTPIVSRWREAIGGFADDAMAADQATAALSAQLQALADQQKAVADETASLIDKITNPAGNLTAMEGALQNLTGVNKGQIIQAIGDDLLRIGDTLKAADRPIPPMIADLYQYAKAQQEAADATAKMVDINDQLASVYNDLGPALNQQLDRLDQERASLESQIIDAQNQAAKTQLEDTLSNTSDLNEYIRTQADMRALDKKIKADKAKADADELQRLQDRLSEVTRLQDVSNDVLQQLGIARSSENDLLDSSITALLERGQALEDERRNLANVTGAAELASNAFGQLAAMLYPFTSQPAIKSYAAGTDFVPATGLYQLHQGEGVLTREENRNKRAGGDIHLNFNGPVVGDMNELADRISDRVLENHQYDVQFGSKRPATRQRAARGNRW